ncbi:MAG: tetratricopeptide repeat protein [Actinoallomurus sp.]
MELVAAALDPRLNPVPAPRTLRTRVTVGSQLLALWCDRFDADGLFKAGKFEQARRAYEEILKTDPTNLNAARQRGYVGLLSNRFSEAEKYLTRALKLAPDDKNTNTLLGDCYIRQDKFSLSVPRWQAIGNEAYAEWFAPTPNERAPSLCHCGWPLITWCTARAASTALEHG